MDRACIGEFAHSVQAFHCDIFMPLTLTSLTPFDDSNTANRYNPLTMTFSENVVLGSGLIRVYRADAPGTPIISVDASDLSVSISGDTVSVALTTPLDNRVEYFVEVDEGAFIGATSGESFAGLAGPTAWNFGTASPA